MGLFLNQIDNLLTTSPGNLLYHIVLVFFIAGALQGAIHLLLSSQFPQARRIVLGLAVLLGLQIILILVSGASARPGRNTSGAGLDHLAVGFSRTIPTRGRCHRST
jgi:hypothetical protein